jgi:hypothetical protein
MSGGCAATREVSGPAAQPATKRPPAPMACVRFRYRQHRRSCAGRASRPGAAGSTARRRCTGHVCRLRRAAALPSPEAAGNPRRARPTARVAAVGPAADRSYRRVLASPAARRGLPASGTIHRRPGGQSGSCSSSAGSGRPEDRGRRNAPRGTTAARRWCKCTSGAGRSRVNSRSAPPGTVACRRCGSSRPSAARGRTGSPAPTASSRCATAHLVGTLGASPGPRSSAFPCRPW